MAVHKKKRSKSIEVFVSEGTAYSAIHKDDNSAWIVEFDMSRKNCGGGIKRVTRSFLDSQDIIILAL